MPPRRFLTLFLILWFSSCRSPEAQTSDRQVLRLGASWGLASLEQDSTPSGSSATALHLLYDVPATHVASATQDGTLVHFTLLPESRQRAKELAESSRFDSLLSAEENADKGVTLTFSSESAAAQVATLDVGGFEIGPFRLHSRTGHTAALYRRERHPIKEIVINEVTAQDEWRLFLGKQLDVIPRAPIQYRHRLAELPSVKILDYPVRHEVNLVFNTRVPMLSNAAHRRSIASLIDREALGRLNSVTNAPVKALPPAEAAVGAGLRGIALELAYLKQDIQMARTALAIRYQLMEQGIEVTLRPVEIEELKRLCFDGGYEATLLPIPIGHRGDTRFLSRSHPATTNITGYANPDYDAAFDSGDVEAMSNFLRRDMPAVPLFKEQYFAAMRSDLCLDDEPDPNSWRWLAAVYPCDRE